MKEKRPRIIRLRDRSENDSLGNFNSRSNRYDRSDDEQQGDPTANDNKHGEQQDRSSSYRNNDQQGDENSGYQQRNNYNRDGGGYQQRNNYNRDGGGYQQRNNYNRDGGGYQQRNNNYNRDGGGYQQRNNYQRNDQQGDGGGYQQRNNNYNRDNGGGYQQRNNNYNRDGGGYQQRNNNYNRDNGGGYQQRNNNYNRDNGGGYQQRNNNYNRDNGGGYQQRNNRDGGGGYQQNNPRFRPEPPQYRDISLFNDAENGVRLNKFLSNAGIASRRKADELISEGHISVNGVVVTEMGFRIQENDKVTYQGKRVYPGRKVYVLLNKPKDTITTTDDPQGRRTVMDLVDGAADDRLYPIGRLDRNSTGVLLLTNDGELAQKLSHPSSEIRKIYHIVLDKPLTKADFQRIVDGVELEDGLVQVDDLAFPYGEDKTQVGVEIHSGKNRIIRRLFDHLEYNVLRLDRVMYSGLTKKGLQRGEWRYLSEKEVIWLRKMGVKR